MTAKEFRTLRIGASVRWKEGPQSPRAGELTDHGIVTTAYGVKAIKWQDGQITDGRDDWALQNVVLDEEHQATLQGEPVRV